MTIVVLTLLRFLLPFSILRWPLAGILASAYLDLSDYHYLLNSDFNMNYYQSWDKIMDTYYLTIAAFTCLSWKEINARNLAIGAFLYRFIGVVLTLLLGTRIFLFFFPNFFENFFIFYLLYKFFRKADLFVSKKVFLIVISAILLPKLLQEYSMHLVQTPPTYIFDLSKIPAVGNFFPRPPELYAQIIFFFTLPTLIFVWRLWETRTKSV